ncbi:MAG: hypothetical protein MJA27_24135 [Pseudanabaenales cyanobacterium]|nr:hypothetical protein [Pseudanabaenales cyanobacterium]
MGVAIKYGRTSLQYTKASDSIRKDRRSSIAVDAETMQTTPHEAMTNEAVMANGRAH